MAISVTLIIAILSLLFNIRIADDFMGVLYFISMTFVECEIKNWFKYECSEISFAFFWFFLLISFFVIPFSFDFSNAVLLYVEGDTTMLVDTISP